MKPSRSILDHTFQYTPAIATSVADTWRRFGWRAKDERRPERLAAEAGPATAVLRDIGKLRQRQRLQAQYPKV